MVEFDSPEGVASVVLVADALEAIEGANLLELEEKLPSVTWDDLFAVSVKPVSDFTAKFEVLATPLKRVLKCYVQWVPRAPRVTLPK